MPFEGGWLLTQSQDKFASRWAPERRRCQQPLNPNIVSSLGSALRELDTLRQEGLISEMEFEQKRRQLLEKKKSRLEDLFSVKTLATVYRHPAPPGQATGIRPDLPPEVLSGSSAGGGAGVYD